MKSILNSTFTNEHGTKLNIGMRFLCGCEYDCGYTYVILGFNHKERCLKVYDEQEEWETVYLYDDILPHQLLTEN